MSALYETDSATLKELEDATTRHAGALARQSGLEARLAEVQDALGYTEIVAPLDGYVVGKEMEPGDLSTPGRTILVVEDIASLEVVANVPEGDIHLVAVGDSVHVDVGNSNDSVFNARVSQVSPSGQQASRQFEVKVVLDPTAAQAGVKSGMFARLTMRKGEREAITVPASAIVRRGQLTGLFTIDSGQRLVLRWVRTGKAFEEQIEVTSGLSAGELYVTSHEGRLQDRQPVRVNSINL
jgi:RND family efflux transporter MFP subunit